MDLYFEQITSGILNFLAPRLVEIKITFTVENCTKIRVNFPNNVRIKEASDLNLSEVVSILINFHIAAS